jgi:hypothetical protein
MVHQTCCAYAILQQEVAVLILEVEDQQHQLLGDEAYSTQIWEIINQNSIGPRHQGATENAIMACLAMAITVHVSFKDNYKMNSFG